MHSEKALTNMPESLKSLNSASQIISVDSTAAEINTLTGS
jgi:hypothetical protein